MVNQKNVDSEKKCRKQLMTQQATRGAAVRMPSEYTTHNNSVEMQSLIARCRHSTAADERPRTLHINESERELQRKTYRVSYARFHNKKYELRNCIKINQSKTRDISAWNE